MAVYDLTQEIPSSVNNGDILNCPYSGRVISIALPKGTFKLECWGAAGGYAYKSNIGGDGGPGGYSVGTIELPAETTLYLYAGEKPDNLVSSGYHEAAVFGGGGSTTSASYGPANAGGGASDIRIGTDSFYARVIVAGAGGGSYSEGSSSYYGIGGYGGGESGTNYITKGSSSASGNPGTQTSGNAFGTGATGASRAGGGGGWYGGGNGNWGPGAGGSGYVYTAATAGNYPSGCLLNSSYYLSDAATIQGSQTITLPNGSSSTGNTSSGYVRITVVSVTSFFYKKDGVWVPGLGIYKKENDSWTITTQVDKSKFSAAVLPIPTVKGSSIFAYDTGVKTLIVNNFRSDYMTATGNSNSIPGSYSAIYSLSDAKYLWTDSTTSDKSIDWSIRMAVPSCTNPLYTGSAVSPTWTNYYSDYMTIGGTTSAVNLGSYTTTFTLNSGLLWMDGTTEVKSITWAIVNVPRDSLCFEFLFDTSLVDTSGNNVTISNGSLASGGRDGRMCLNAASSVASLSNDCLGANSWSVSYWVKAPSTNKKWNVYFGQYAPMGSELNVGQFFMDERSSYYRAWAMNGNSRWTVDLPILYDNWTHIVLVSDYANNVAIIYVNGVCIGSNAGYATHGRYGTVSSQPIYFGKTFDGSKSAVYFDDVRMYSRVLTSDEVKGLYAEVR